MRVYAIAQTFGTEDQAHSFIDSVLDLHQDLQIAIKVIENAGQWLASVFWAAKDELVQFYLKKKTVKELEAIAKSDKISLSSAGYKKELKTAEDIRFELEDMPEYQVLLVPQDYRTISRKYLTDTWVLKEWAIDRAVRILTEGCYCPTAIKEVCKDYGISQYKKVWYEKGIKLTKDRLIGRLLTTSSYVWDMFSYWS